MFQIKVNLLQSAQTGRLTVTAHTFSLQLGRRCQSQLGRPGRVLTWICDMPLSKGLLLLFSQMGISFFSQRPLKNELQKVEKLLHHSSTFLLLLTDERKI